jgi:hypothetical protein
MTGTVYLLHSDRPYVSADGKGVAKHYTGNPESSAFLNGWCRVKGGEFVELPASWRVDSREGWLADRGCLIAGETPGVGRGIVRFRPSPLAQSAGLGSATEEPADRAPVRRFWHIQPCTGGPFPLQGRSGPR